MKSIKEKAEEYTSDIENQVANNVAFLAYRSGANYVLEQITEAIRLCDNDRNTDLYKSLWNCIDELRK